MKKINLKCKSSSYMPNDLKGVQVMKKINLKCKSSSYMHSNNEIKLKVVMLIEYT